MIQYKSRDIVLGTNINVEKSRDSYESVQVERHRFEFNYNVDKSSDSYDSEQVVRNHFFVLSVSIII